MNVFKARAIDASSNLKESEALKIDYSIRLLCSIVENISVGIFYYSNKADMIMPYIGHQVAIDPFGSHSINNCLHLRS